MVALLLSLGMFTVSHASTVRHSLGLQKSFLCFVLHDLQVTQGISLGVGQNNQLFFVFYLHLKNELLADIVYVKSAK